MNIKLISFGTLPETLVSFYIVVFLVLWIALANQYEGTSPKSKAMEDAILWPAYLYSTYVNKE